jgi:hypothetical protein
VVLAAAPIAKVDILFMIDNSSSMTTSQVKLKNAFPGFMSALEALPGGLPDVHIAVVSSDMGAGDGVSIQGCSLHGDDGVFQFAPTAGCTSSTLQSGATFITDTGGSSPVTNFTATDISTVFSCIAQLGAFGCGFEHQLASVARALGADGLGAAPPENAGFVRPDADLAIVLLTNEDDCSAPFGTDLYDTSADMLASPYGPVDNYRCNEFGHLCGTPPAPPPRLSPNPSDLSTTVTLDNCTSAECSGKLTPVAEFAARLRALKAGSANRVLVAALAGPATPYAVNWITPPLVDTGPWPVIQHSCGSVSSADGFADPAVRIRQFVQAFGADGVVGSFCDPDFGTTMQALAQRIGATGAGTPAFDGGITSCVTVDGGAGGATGAGGGGGAGGSGGAAGAGATGSAGRGATGAGAADGGGAAGAGGAGGSATDAGAPVDATGAGNAGGRDAAADAPHPSGGGGCGCRLADARGDAGALAAVGLVIPMLARRRRK